MDNAQRLLLPCMFITNGMFDLSVCVGDFGLENQDHRSFYLYLIQVLAHIYFISVTSLIFAFVPT